MREKKREFLSRRILTLPTVFTQSPEEIAFSVEAVVKAGANIIGGCCGTTPEHIRRIAQKVRHKWQEGKMARGQEGNL